MDGDPDGVAEARQRLVDRVVHHLVDQVMQPVLAGGPDVHPRPLADRVESLEDLDAVGAVLAVAHRCRFFRHDTRV